RPLSSRPRVRQRLLPRMLCFAGLATSTRTACAVPSCFRGRSTLKHAHRKRKSVSTQRERLKPPFVVGRSLRVKQRVSYSISCDFQRIPCSRKERIFALFSESPAKSAKRGAFLRLVKFPFCPSHPA